MDFGSLCGGFVLSNFRNRHSKIEKVGKKREREGEAKCKKENWQNCAKVKNVFLHLAVSTKFKKTLQQNDEKLVRFWFLKNLFELPDNSVFTTAYHVWSAQKDRKKSKNSFKIFWDSMVNLKKIP